MKYNEFLYYIPLVRQILCDVKTLTLSITIPDFTNIACENQM